MSGRNLVMLGPQRLSPTLDRAVRSLGVKGPLAVVTAGWEEREAEDQELSEHLGGRARNLNLYERAEDVFQKDPELFGAMRARHDRMRALQELYRLRLQYALEAARELLHREGDEELLEVEREAAVEAVRVLDAHHYARLEAAHRTFEEEWSPLERPAVVHHRRELEALLEGTEALCVAGGHVAILLNRMRLFGLLDLLAPAKPVLAWSAGAMVLSERVVLFHDSPPQGPGNAEVLELGLGLFPAVVPLPHAKKRLRLDDETRVALFARRFGPALCAALDPGARLDWDGERWSNVGTTRRLSEEGQVLEVAAA